VQKANEDTQVEAWV